MGHTNSHAGEPIKARTRFERERIARQVEGSAAHAMLLHMSDTRRQQFRDVHAFANLCVSSSALRSTFVPRVTSHFINSPNYLFISRVADQTARTL